MTAGHGIIHNEFHSADFAKTGGTLEMMQLWVNLPAAVKLTPAKYQSILKKEIPEVSLGANVGAVRVIAGAFNGVRGTASTFTPINLWDVSLTPNQTVEFTTVEGHTTIIFCRTGSVILNPSDSMTAASSSGLKPAQIGILSRIGNKISLASGMEGSHFMVLDGEPINESIAARGPFVMNTDAELRQAANDYQNGLMG